MAANLELEKTPSGFGLGIDDECFITGALSAAAREALLSIGVPVSAGNTQGANAQNSARIVRIDGEPVSNLRDIVGKVSSCPAGALVKFELELPRPAANANAEAPEQTLEGSTADQPRFATSASSAERAAQLALGATAQLAAGASVYVQKGRELVKDLGDPETRERLNVMRVCTTTMVGQLGEQAVAPVLASAGFNQLGNLLPGNAGRSIISWQRRRPSANGPLAKAGIDYSKYSDHELAGVLYQFELSTSVLEELAVLSARVVDDLATAGIAHTQLAQAVGAATVHVQTDLDAALLSEADGPTAGVFPFWQAGSSAIAPLADELKRLGETCNGIATAATNGCSDKTKTLQAAADDLRALASKPVEDFVATIRKYHREQAIEAGLRDAAAGRQGATSRSGGQIAARRAAALASLDKLRETVLAKQHMFEVNRKQAVDAWVTAFVECQHAFWSGATTTHSPLQVESKQRMAPAPAPLQPGQQARRQSIEPDPDLAPLQITSTANATHGGPNESWRSQANVGSVAVDNQEMLEKAEMLLSRIDQPSSPSVSTLSDTKQNSQPLAAAAASIFKRAERHASEERWDDCRQDAEAAIAAGYPEKAQAHYLLGVALAELERREEAVTALRAAITADPTHEWAAEELQQLLTSMPSSDSVDRGPL